MCRMQCSLALIALSIGVVHSWDIAITTGNQLEFYTNNTKIDNVGTQFRDLTALAYDAVHNMLLFVDTQNDNASIFTYHLAGKKYQSLVRRRSLENIQGLAFDAVTSMLFWTDSSERSIFCTSLKPGSENGPYGKLLLKMDDEIPRAIAVDSCRGYIYWSNTNVSKPTIERARFDGSQREVLVHTDIYMPVSLAIDQRTKRLYWIDDREGIHYSIESSDLEGNNRITMWRGIQHQPNALTVSKDAIYWIDWGFKTIWKLPKNVMNSHPKPLIVFSNEVPHGIVANYQIQDQTEGVPECENFKSLSQNKSAINDSFSVPRDRGLFCLHGVKIDGKSECKCTPGYIGNRCHISVCDNYCFQGDCSLTTDGKVGQPICSCNEGYEGDRCEINLCHGYCLNNGVCSFNENHKPVCSCSGEYEGTRCESEKLLRTTMPTEVIVSEPCNCTKNVTTVTAPILPSEQLRPTDGEFVMASSISNDGWDPIRDPVIMVLGILCGVLCLACAVLITKILQLKKRPRIKKRIIVNKNVTPLTARPDQCEITIENCCNMNICETPCFEPRSTIRPTLLESKPGKEEKRNLISNMEYPDDY